MANVDMFRGLFAQLSVLLALASGLLVMVSWMAPKLRRLAARAMLLACLTIVVSALITPRWLP